MWSNFLRISIQTKRQRLRTKNVIVVFLLMLPQSLTCKATHHNKLTSLKWVNQKMDTQQDYYDLQYGTLLHSYCTGIETEQHCSFEVSLPLPCCTYTATLLEYLRGYWSYFKAAPLLLLCRYHAVTVAGHSNLAVYIPSVQLLRLIFCLQYKNSMDYSVYQIRHISWKIKIRCCPCATHLPWYSPNYIDVAGLVDDESNGTSSIPWGMLLQCVQQNSSIEAVTLMKKVRMVQ